MERILQIALLFGSFALAPLQGAFVFDDSLECGLGYLPPFESSCSHGISFQGKYLLMQGYNHLKPGYWLGFQRGDGNPPSLDTKILSQNLGWHSGWQLGAKMALPQKTWNLQGDWTHLAMHSTQKWEDPGATEGQSQGSVIFPTYVVWPFFEEPITNNQMHSEVKLSYNDLLLAVYKECFLGEALLIAPHLGLKGIHIHTRFHESYSAGGAESLVRFDADQELSFFGIGIETGFQAHWIWGAGFSLYGEGALALYQGWLRLKGNEEALSQTLEGTLRHFAPFQDRWTQGIYELRAAFGVRYLTRFACDRNALSFRIGWQEKYVEEQSRFPYSPLASGTVYPLQGPLFWSGLELGLEVSY